MFLLINTNKISIEYLGTSRALYIMVYFFINLALSIWFPILIQFMVATQMTDIMSVLIVFSLKIIWSLGNPQSNLLFLELMLNQSIEVWLLLLLNLSGFDHCYKNSIYLLLVFFWYYVIVCLLNN